MLTLFIANLVTLLVTADAVICDHAVRLSKFGMLITLLNLVPCPVTDLNILICK